MATRFPEKFKPLLPWFQRHRRTCWKPVVDKGDGPLGCSKFAGTPYLGAREDWPACGFCHGPMRFSVQVDLNSLPASERRRVGSGLLQVFLCIKDSCLYDNYGDPFSKGYLLRVVKRAGSGRVSPLPKFDDGHPRPFPPKTITAWKQADDYPACAELAELGLVLEEEEGQVRSVKPAFAADADLEEVLDELKDRFPAYPKDKMGGWPAWVQNAEYPTCPQCGSRMDSVVFQLTSRDKIPFDIADGGRGPILQCPKHKQVLAFPWSSG